MVFERAGKLLASMIGGKGGRLSHLPRIITHFRAEKATKGYRFWNGADKTETTPRFHRGVAIHFLFFPKEAEEKIIVRRGG